METNPKCLPAQERRAAIVAAEVGTAATSALFNGTIQGLAMQSLLAWDVECLRTDASGAFAIYRHGLGSEA